MMPKISGILVPKSINQHQIAHRLIITRRVSPKKAPSFPRTKLELLLQVQLNPNGIIVVVVVVVRQAGPPTHSSFQSALISIIEPSHRRRRRRQNRIDSIN